MRLWVFRFSSICIFLGLIVDWHFLIYAIILDWITYHPKKRNFFGFQFLYLRTLRTRWLHWLIMKLLLQLEKRVNLISPDLMNLTIENITEGLKIWSSYLDSTIRGIHRNFLKMPQNLGFSFTIAFYSISGKLYHFKLNIQN